MKILIFAGLSNKKFSSKILPLLDIDEVEKVYLVRNASFHHTKVKNLTIPSYLNIPYIRELVKALISLFLCFTKRIDYVMGIYFIPHGILAGIVGMLCRKPMIQLIIGDDTEFIKRYKNFSGILLRASYKIGVRGQRTKKLLEKIVRDSDRIFIQHNVYEFRTRRRLIEDNVVDFHIVSVGNFTRVKRVDRFLQVLERVKRSFPGLRAVFVGDGPPGEKDFYERMRDTMGLMDNVDFVGAVEDVSHYLDRARVFIMTSDMEGLPMAMIEAMAAGLPCVMPDVGNISDIVQDGVNGFLVEAEDVEGYSAKIGLLLKDDALYRKLSANALSAINKKAQEFSFSSIQEQWKLVLL